MPLCHARYCLIIIELCENLWRRRDRVVGTSPGDLHTEFETQFREKRPCVGPIGNDVSHPAPGPAGPVRRCVFNYSIIHPAIHHQPSVKFILFLCIGPLQFAAPCINLLLAAICLARAASNTIVPICRGVRGYVSNRWRGPGTCPFSQKFVCRNAKTKRKRERIIGPENQNAFV